MNSEVRLEPVGLPSTKLTIATGVHASADPSLSLAEQALKSEVSTSRLNLEFAIEASTSGKKVNLHRRGQIIW